MATPLASDKPPTLPRSAIWELVGVWVVVRCVLFFWAAVISFNLSAHTALEKQYPNFWPPGEPFGAWLERVVVAPWLRWDVEWYQQIIVQGYRSDDGTTQFHPLLTWMAAPFTWLGLSPVASLLLVSSVSGLLAIVAFARLALYDLPLRQVRISTWLLLFAPPAFILFAPYTEALFLLWSVLTFWYARQGSWWLAGLAGLLATLTRQQGLFLLLPLAWELWAAAEYDWRKALAAWRSWLALSLVPLGMGIWIIYRAFALSDLEPDFSSLHGLIYSVLISPSSSKVVPDQTFMFPPAALWYALQNIDTNPAYTSYNLVDLILGGGFLVLLVFSWPYMRVSYRIYSVVIVLVSFAYNTGTFVPYMGLPRHLLLAFPVFIGLGGFFLHTRAWLVLLAGGICLLIFLLQLYVLHSWVP